LKKMVLDKGRLIRHKTMTKYFDEPKPEEPQTPAALRLGDDAEETPDSGTPAA
jgi:hypothetical protein